MKAILPLCAIAACFLYGIAGASGLPDKGQGVAEIGQGATPDSTAIPEPALAVLLGLVGVFLLLRRR